MGHRMNSLLIAVLIILIGAALVGYWRGLVRIAFSLIASVLVIVLVTWITPYVTDFLKENTTIYENLVENCAQKVQTSAEHTIQESGKNEKNELPNIGLPEVWVKQMMEKAGDTVEQAVEESGIYRQVGAYIADWILKGIAFFAAFILISLLLRLVVGLLDIVTKLPLVKGVNRLLGGVAGFLLGMVFVWLLLFLVAIACTSEWGQTMLTYISDSPFLTWLYQNNGILYFFQYMSG